MSVRELKLKNLHRDLYQLFEATIIIPKGEHGEETDKILSSAMQELESAGRLQELWSKVHTPYVDWQPYQMKD